MSRRARRRGLFVALEGIDGAGTTTQGRRLVAALRRQGQAALFTREPSDGVVGRYIRRCLRQQPGPSPERLALLFAADRLDHLETVVAPALATGQVVVSDRYVLSSLAYQGVEGEVDWIAQLNARAPAPDLTVLLDVSAAEATRRRRHRGGQADRYEVTPFQRRVAARYRQLARLETAGDVLVIDGAATVEAIAQALLAEVEPLLGPRPRS